MESRVCVHYMSDAGCALGSFCKFQHVDERRPAVAASQSTTLWVWRENTSARSQFVNQWQLFADEWQEELEQNFAEGKEEFFFKGQAISLDRMYMRNTVDGGDRRPIQRLLCSIMPSWFTVSSDGSATLCDASASSTLEYYYISGIRSLITLFIRGVLYSINMFTMTAKAVVGQVSERLVRQFALLENGGPAADLYAVEELHKRASFIDSTQVPLLCVDGKCARVVRDSDEPAYLSLDQFMKAPPTACSKSACWQSALAQHFWSYTHGCPFGKKASCFLCSDESSTRSKIHRLLFAHDVVSNNTGADSLLSVDVHWRQHQDVVRVFRKRWTGNQSAAELTMRNVHVGSDEGQWVCGFFDNEKVSVLRMFPRLQRIEAPLLLDRYLRARNEAFLQLCDEDRDFALETVECSMFTHVKRGDIGVILNGEQERTTFFPSPLAAQGHTDGRTAWGDDSLLAVCVVFPGRRYTWPESEGQSRFASLVCPPSQRTGKKRTSFHSVSMPASGLLLCLDPCMWCPMYFLELTTQ